MLNTMSAALGKLLRFQVYRPLLVREVLYHRKCLLRHLTGHKCLRFPLARLSLYRKECQRVDTWERDCWRLARLHGAGQLVAAQVPAVAEGASRDGTWHDPRDADRTKRQDLASPMVSQFQCITAGKSVAVTRHNLAVHIDHPAGQVGRKLVFPATDQALAEKRAVPAVRLPKAQSNFLGL